MEPDEARFFRLQLREARENALKDAEAFDEIIHAIERLGSFVYTGTQRNPGFGSYEADLLELAKDSALATMTQSADEPRPFSLLYNLVRVARNDAVHQGMFARHLTMHAVQLGLILEDALMRKTSPPARVEDYMVREPVRAQWWQPISFIRQQMLVNSFSYLPLPPRAGSEEWYLLPDFAIARYLQSVDEDERGKRLREKLEDAGAELGDKLQEVKWWCSEKMLIKDVLNRFSGVPILVERTEGKNDLVGILTAFDLL